MDVVALTPRGYCHGVVGAINTLRTIGQQSDVPRPIYVLGRVVHNEKIVNDFEELGIITLEGESRLDMLDRVEGGSVVITAHGASRGVFEKAYAKGLHVIDTTCSDVYTSQRTMEDYTKQGYTVVFIGKHTHPESETARTIDGVRIVQTTDEAKKLRIDNPHIAITNQTTMSLYDIYPIAQTIKTTYPQSVLIEEICDATKTRQEAVMNQDSSIEHCFVVGDPGSNNTAQLARVSHSVGIPATRIPSVEGLDVTMLKNLSKVSVTAGASTPTPLAREVIRFLRAFEANDPKTHDTHSAIKRTNLFKKQ